MPIGAELLNPIPGPNPSGANLRYDPIYDKIKEARREEDEIPQGEMQYAIKKADWPLVVKLCSEALTKKSKDLQLAAWLTEALVRREGFAGLRQGLDLCRGLVEQFWDTLYPEPEDGDLELRAASLDWIGGRFDGTLKKIPLTRSGLDWYKYKESRSVGYEADVGESELKRAARDQALADGKTTAEDFDKAVLASPKDSYKQKIADIDTCGESIDALAAVCEARFGDFSPSFSGLRESLEVLRQAVKSLLAKKLEQEPDEPQVVEAGGEEQTLEEAGESVGGSGVAAAAARAPDKRVFAGDPTDKDDAFERVAAVARWLRTQDTYNPVPYVMLRALRWSELRATGSEIDPNLLVAPATELRQRIKKLAIDSSWEELIGACEEAMALPCARAWLDLQRYFLAACDGYGGYESVKNAVLAELKSLLADYPGLPQMSLLDDTPTANAETQAWLQTIIVPAAPTPVEEYTPAPVEESAEPAPGGAPDAFELAKQAARSGRTDEAIKILSHEAAQERSGRARFQRKVQLAQVCIAAGYETIAYPILQGLADEIEKRSLEDWESAEILAHALGLLFRSMNKLNEDAERKQRLYARICRLDPLQAIELAP